MPLKYKVFFLAIVASMLISLESILTRKPFIILTPVHSALVFYISGVTLLLLVNKRIVTSFPKRCSLQVIQVSILSKYSKFLALTMWILLMLYLEVPIKMEGVKFTLILALTVLMITVLRLTKATSESVFVYLLIALSVSFHIWSCYPYYVGNDTNRDLSYTFNVLITGVYEGQGVYPVNIATYLYSVLSLVVNHEVFSTAVLLVEIAYIVSLAGLLIFIMKDMVSQNKNILAVLLMLLVQPYFIIWLTSWFINQTLAILYVLIMFYILTISSKDRAHLRSHTYVLSLLGVITSITHGSLSLYFVGLLLFSSFYIQKYFKNSLYVKLTHQIIPILVISTVTYTTYTAILNWVNMAQKTLRTFISSFIMSLTGGEEHARVILPRLGEPQQMLWFYLPLANLLAFTIAEYMANDETDRHRKLWDLVFLYSAFWVAIGIITSTDPVASLIRYFIVPGLVFLSMYPRKILVNKNIGIVHVLVALSVISALTSGAIVSSLDLMNSGQGYPIYPPATEEAELLATTLVRLSHSDITVVTDLRLASGITQASLNLIQSKITVYPLGVYLPALDGGRIDLKYLGGYGWVLDDNTLYEIRSKGWILILRPKALEYMRLYMLDEHYNEIIQSSKALIFQSYSTSAIVP